jgi:maleate cis-trans isomerase
MGDSSDIRVGVLVPAGNRVHEREFNRLNPAGVNFRFGGFSYPRAGSSSFCDDLVVQFTQPIQELTGWGANLVLIGCTTASMTCADEAYIAKLQAIAGVPVITAASASREAINALGVRSVSVATPYGELNNRIIAEFLESIGVEVAAMQGLDLDRSVETWLTGQPTLTPQRVLDFSLSVDVEQAQALYLPCTGMSSLEAIEMFERQTGKAAFSSVQAGYWASLRRLGLDGRQSGNGRLLDLWDFPA